MSSNSSNPALPTLGDILVKDYLLLEESVLTQSNLSELLLTHQNYLLSQNFKEFRLMIPHDTAGNIVSVLNNFIQQCPIPGAIRNYLSVDNSTKFLEEININPDVAFKNWLCILPSEDFRYESLRKKIWNLAQEGKSIMILMPERVKEWNGRISFLKRMHIKGANFAMSATYQFRWGFWHKKNYKSIHQNKLIAMWITPQIIDVADTKFRKDIDCKLEIINAYKTFPNDL